MAFTSLPPKGPSQATCYSSISADNPQEMPRPCSANVLAEEQPFWLEDLLNEPDSPINKTHRRSSTDPFAFLDANDNPEESCLWYTWGPTWNFPITNNPTGQVPSINKPISFREQDYSWKSSLVSPQLPNGLASPTEDAEFKALGLCCSPPKSDRMALAGREIQSQVDAVSYASENASEESNFSQPHTKPMLPPPASKSDVKRKQHNARRSRIRKLQHIADLERNVQALQVEGVEVSTQLEFLDQQNLLLGMENRALKQRLENLSQELLIKSLEQEILDREVGRLQYLYQYQMQNVNQHKQRRGHKQIPAIDRRGRSCDFDSQFTKFTSNPPEAISACNGFKDFPYRN